jgi:hypothetical protein
MRHLSFWAEIRKQIQQGKKIEQEKMLSNCCYLVADGWGWCFIFFPAVVWRRRRKKSALVEVEVCVCI